AFLGLRRFEHSACGRVINAAKAIRAPLGAYAAAEFFVSPGPGPLSDPREFEGQLAAALSLAKAPRGIAPWARIFAGEERLQPSPGPSQRAFRASGSAMERMRWSIFRSFSI